MVLVCWVSWALHFFSSPFVRIRRKHVLEMHHDHSHSNFLFFPPYVIKALVVWSIGNSDFCSRLYTLNSMADSSKCCWVSSRERQANYRLPTFCKFYNFDFRSISDHFFFPLSFCYFQPPQSNTRCQTTLLSIFSRSYCTRIGNIWRFTSVHFCKNCMPSTSFSLVWREWELGVRSCCDVVRQFVKVSCQSH